VVVRTAAERAVAHVEAVSQPAAGPHRTVDDDRPAGVGENHRGRPASAVAGDGQLELVELAADGGERHRPDAVGAHISLAVEVVATAVEVAAAAAALVGDAGDDHQPLLGSTVSARPARAGIGHGEVVLTGAARGSPTDAKGKDGF